jgi:hypothetical protein
MPGMGAQVGIAMLVEDIGDLQGGARHAPLPQTGGTSLGRSWLSGLATARSVFTATRV